MKLSVNLQLFSAACGAIAVLTAQSPPAESDWQTAAGGKMTFDVASVKRAKPGTFVQPNMFLDNGNAKPAGGLFRGSWLLAGYIHFAWKLDRGQDDAMSAQLPKWTTGQSWVVEAKAEGNPTKDQIRLMMQSLLADRFKLKVHFETKDGPVWALTLVEPGKLGPKLIPHSEGPPCPDSYAILDFSKLPQLPKPGVEWRNCGESAMTRGTPERTEIGARNTTPGLIADSVSAYGSMLGELDKPVVDQTGLKGTFDFMIELPPGMISLIPAPPNPDASPKGTPFLDALRKQLGLKLERSRGPIRKLIIDYIEQPSRN